MLNQIIFIIIAVVVVIAIVFSIRERMFENDDELEDGEDKQKKYQYKRKNFFMSRAEHECFDAIFKAVGNEYFIFAQVHLPTLLEYQIYRQNWRGALSHINRKSVDFVLCDKNYISPKLAIVMIGQNNGPSNTAEEIAEGVSDILEKLRKKLPDMKILLLGIFFRGEKPNDEQMKLTTTNEILAKMADGQHLVYMNINKIFLNPDGTIPKSLMPDFEHPNEQGCRIWAEIIEPTVAQLLGESAIKP